MIRLFFFILIVNLSSTIFAQSQKYFLVQFSDKNSTQYTLDNPQAYLSEKAIERRSNQSIEIDSTDLPVVQQYIDEVAATGATIWYPLKWINGVIVSNADSLQIVALSNVSHVMNMADKTLGGIESSSISMETYDYGEAERQNVLLGIDDMHNEGYTGEGIGIAVLDAGFRRYSENPYFNDLLVGETYDFYDKDTIVNNDHSHGADVLSTMAAFEDGSFVGGAPNATYYLYRTENVAFESRIEELMWMAAAERADSIGVNIIQSSLGYYEFDHEDQNYSKSDLDGQSAWITIAANHAYTKGILVVSSAGNEGSSAWGKISFPSDSPFVLAVGSVNNNNLFKAFSSSFGPTADGRIKPDVSAIGGGAQIINSSGNVSVTNGTSFSAPQVAALAAGLIQALPEETTPMDIIERIRNSGDKFYAPDTLLGYGIPDFQRAFLLTSLEENDQLFKKVKVYPNPVNGSTIKVEFPKKFQGKDVEFIWYSMGGKTLMKDIKYNINNNISLDLPQNQRGKYLLLKVSTNEFFKTFKVKVN